MYDRKQSKCRKKEPRARANDQIAAYRRDDIAQDRLNRAYQEDYGGRDNPSIYRNDNRQWNRYVRAFDDIDRAWLANQRNNKELEKIIRAREARRKNDPVNEADDDDEDYDLENDPDFGRVDDYDYFQDDNRRKMDGIRAANVLVPRPNPRNKKKKSKAP